METSVNIALVTIVTLFSIFHRKVVISVYVFTAVYQIACARACVRVLVSVLCVFAENIHYRLTLPVCK